MPTRTFTITASPPNASLPGAYTLSFHGTASNFAGDGTARGGLRAGGNLRDEIVRLCKAEHAYFDNGRAKETDDPQYKRVGDYWKSIGLAYDGRDTDRFWSAAFISWVLDTAGAGARFPGAAGHSRYFQHFVNTTDPLALYEAMPQVGAVPEPGDIVHYGRQTAKRYDFAEAAAAYGADTFYPSHADIVVEKRDGELVTIGGNVSSTVGKKTVAIDAGGQLVDRTEDGQGYPWIGVLKLRL